MSEIRKPIIIALIGVGLLVGLWYVAQYCKDESVFERHIEAQQKALDRVPTFRELQKKVGAEPDGIIGPDTIARWEREICNRHTREAMARMAGDKE